MNNMDTYTVALMTDYGWTEICHPLAVGVDKQTAKSIWRHFTKHCDWNDFTQTGTYVRMVSRTYCTNHEDFEKETTLYMEYEDEEPFERDEESNAEFLAGMTWDDIYGI